MRRYFHPRGIVGLAVGVLGVGIILYLVWHLPLGPGLVRTPPAAAKPPTTIYPAVTATHMPPTPQPTEQPICDGLTLMYLMLVGTDTHYHDYTGFADVIRIVRIDFVARSVTMLAVPRDLWVRIPGLETHHIIENRIKTAYSYGNYYQTNGGGPSLLTQTLSLNFGIRVDHYMIVDFSDFVTAIDAIGGIDINVPSPLHAGDLYFPAGRQHLDGTQSLAYARVRDNISDLERIDRQTELLWAVRNKVMTTQILPRLDDLTRPIVDGAVTDMSPAEISALICLGTKIKAASVQTAKIDGFMTHSLVDAWGHEILEPDFDAIRLMVAKFNTGKTSLEQAFP